MQPQEIPSVHPRHHQVEEDETRCDLPAVKEVERLGAFRRGGDAEAVLLQDLPEALPEKGVVLDEKDLVHFGGTRVDELARGGPPGPEPLERLEFRLPDDGGRGYSK